MITVYISIGNSDDKLTQVEWSTFCRQVQSIVYLESYRMHGEWFSDPTAPYQNMCWCVDVAEPHITDLRSELKDLARRFKQDSIAWAEIKGTEFLSHESMATKGIQNPG